MQRLKGYLKFVSLLFLVLSFVSLILTFINQGVIKDVLGGDVKWINTLFSVFPSWLGLYPISAFFLFVSFIALFIRRTGKRLLLYLFDAVIVGGFTLFSKYVLKENKPGTILTLIIVAFLMLLTVSGLIIVFYRPKKTAHSKKNKNRKEKKAAKEADKMVRNEQREEERQQRIRDAELRRLEREQKAREKEEQRRADLERRRIALEEQRLKRENELKEREAKREREIEERRIRREEETLHRIKEAELAEQKRKDDIQKRALERQQEAEERIRKLSALSKVTSSKPSVTEQDTALSSPQTPYTPDDKETPNQTHTTLETTNNAGNHYHTGSCSARGT